MPEAKRCSAMTELPPGRRTGGKALEPCAVVGRLRRSARVWSVPGGAAIGGAALPRCPYLEDLPAWPGTGGMLAHAARRSSTCCLLDGGQQIDAARPSAGHAARPATMKTASDGDAAKARLPRALSIDPVGPCGDGPSRARRAGAVSLALVSRPSTNATSLSVSTTCYAVGTQRPAAAGRAGSAAWSRGFRSHRMSARSAPASTEQDKDSVETRRAHGQSRSRARGRCQGLLTSGR